MSVAHALGKVGAVRGGEGGCVRRWQAGRQADG